MRENEASIRGRVVRDLIAHTTNDLLTDRNGGTAVEVSGMFYHADD